MSRYTANLLLFTRQTVITRLTLKTFKKPLNYVSDASGTYLVSSLWYLDSSQELKDINGYTTPLKYIGNSHTVELYGRLHADLFNSEKMLMVLI